MKIINFKNYISLITHFYKNLGFVTLIIKLKNQHNILFN